MLRHQITIPQKTSQNARDLCLYQKFRSVLLPNLRDRVPGFDDITDHTHIFENTRCLRVNHPLCTVSTDHARNPRIRDCRTLADNSPQPVTALCLHHNIHILTCRKARTKCNRERCHIPTGSKISLCQNRIDHNSRFQRSNRHAFRINQNRHAIFLPDRFCLLISINPDSTKPLDLSCFCINRLTQSYLSPDRRRIFNLQHQHPKPCRPEPMNRPSCQVTAAAHNN